MPLTACAYRKKGDDAFASRISNNAFSSSVVRGVSGTITRACLVQVSDQRGTCLVAGHAKGGLCL